MPAKIKTFQIFITEIEPGGTRLCVNGYTHSSMSQCAPNLPMTANIIAAVVAFSTVTMKNGLTTVQV